MTSVYEEIKRRLEMVDAGTLEPVALTEPDCGWGDGNPHGAAWYDLGDGWQVKVFWRMDGVSGPHKVRTPEGRTHDLASVESGDDLCFWFDCGRSDDAWLPAHLRR